MKRRVKVETEICPRCLDHYEHRGEVGRALSRRDNTTYICSDCGREEALVDMGILKDQESKAREARIARLTLKGHI